MDMPVRILLVDDDADDRHLFKDALKDFQAECVLVEAENGDEAIELLRGGMQLPHLVVMDINMPVMSGLDALAAIRNELELKLLPVIIMSTSVDQATIVISQDLGANHYVYKPSKFETLQKIVVFFINQFKHGYGLGRGKLPFLLNSLFDQSVSLPANH